MVSSSYQSSLLRFAVGQYRRGVERHRKALGRASSTVKLGAELGVALVVLPVYVAARISISAGRRLSDSVMGRSLPALSGRARKLLNFSDFESDVEELIDELGPDLSLAAGTVRALPTLAQPMLQILTAVGRCLCEPQIAELSDPSNVFGATCSSSSAVDTGDSGLSGSRLRRWAKDFRIAAKRLLNFEEVALTNLGGLMAANPRRITGVASDIKTRSLLLVLDYEVAWNGLSPVQQQRLQDQIVMLVGGGALARKKGLVPFAAVVRWLAAGKVLLRQLQWHRENLQKLLPMPSRSAISRRSQRLALSARSQSDIACAVVQADASKRSFSSLVLAPKASMVSATTSCSRATSKGETADRDLDAIEADVISTVYMEHPLEKVLKWVDRILLWIETQWQWLKQRLVSRIETIFHL